MSLLVVVAIALVAAWVVSLGFALALCRAAARTPRGTRRLPRQVTVHAGRATGPDESGNGH